MLVCSFEGGGRAGYKVVYLALAKWKLGGRFLLNGYRAGYMLCLTVALVPCPDAMSCAPEVVGVSGRV
jgi:hypothetical protein